MLSPKLLDRLHPFVRQGQSLAVRLFQGTTLGVRALVCDGSGLLLVRHTYVSGWHLPGGGVHPRESAEVAACRELAEETGYAADGPVRFIGLYFNPACAGRDHVALYHIPTYRVGSVFRPNREIAEIGVFPLDALPPGTTQATRDRLAEVYAGATLSPIW